MAFRPERSEEPGGLHHDGADRQTPESESAARMVGKRKRGSLLTSHQKCWLWGRHAVLETLRAGKWRPLELYVDRQAVEPAILSELAKSARDQSFSLIASTSSRMTQLCGSREHQGVMAKMPPYPYASFDLLVNRLGAESFLLVLDGIQDPFNFGAILRSADLLRADGVVVPTQRQSPVTSHVARSSAGAVGYLDIAEVDSLPAAFGRLRERGLLLIAASEKTPRDSGTVPPWDCDLTRGLALVIGNEGSGISDELLAACDERICIPQGGHVGSLNAAVAAGILCYEIRRQRSTGVRCP